ncbi:MAG: DnaJ domain-containing protein [Sandaracinaceae bacterium]|nr:DnaJ domain-containing protein [Sandaracinaceae bacterium]
MPATLSPALQALWKEVEERAHAMETQNYYEMLGVARDANAAAIQKAYFGLVKKWHPDRVPAELAPLRPQVESIFRYLTRAQETLCDTEKRGQYLATVQDGGGTPEAEKKLSEIVQAAMDFRKVEVFLRQRQFDQALALVERILEVTQEDADYHAAQGWALFSLHPTSAPERSRALAAIDRALALNPKHDRAHYYKASILKRLGCEDEALEHLRQAVALNPRNVEAAREVRLAEMRGAPKDGGATSSLFSKLFKKK